jgi:hypothetical protein
MINGGFLMCCFFVASDFNLFAITPFIQMLSLATYADVGLVVGKQSSTANICRRSVKARKLVWSTFFRGGILGKWLDARASSSDVTVGLQISMFDAIRVGGSPCSTLVCSVAHAQQL